jgi:hypothetical protein
MKYPEHLPFEKEVMKNKFDFAPVISGIKNNAANENRKMLQFTY